MGPPSKISLLKENSQRMTRKKESQPVSSPSTRLKLKLLDQPSSPPRKDSLVKLSLNISVTTGPKPGDITIEPIRIHPSRLRTNACQIPRQRSISSTLSALISYH